MRDPEEAVAGADCVVTDTWVSMGDKEAKRRHNMLKPYQVNDALMKHARSRTRSSCTACPRIAARK
jgi:ornithine carbamoyltransferase